MSKKKGLMSKIKKGIYKSAEIVGKTVRKVGPFIAAAAVTAVAISKHQDGNSSSPQ